MGKKKATTTRDSRKPSEIEKLLTQSNLSENEIKSLLRSKKPGIRKNPHYHDFGSDVIKIGIVSDLHVGSKYYNHHVIEAAAQLFDETGVEKVYIPGDIIEGMSNRAGHIYELDILGVSNQVYAAAEELAKISQPVYFITGNHDQWAKNKADQGVEVGQMIEDMAEDTHFLGDMEATVYLNDNIRMDLTHRGNTSYALSYSGQKRINALEGGKKPHVLINGHIHKALYMFYRNIHFLEAGSAQNQTDFMAMKGSPSHVGFWTADIRHNGKEITEFKSAWHPVYTE